MKKRLTIITVNYNAGDYLLRCLESIERHAEEVSLKTVIIDNASVDDSIERAKKKKFKDVEFILSEKNVGFGSGNNIALRKLDTEYALLFNPDSQLEDGTLKYMIDYMDNNPEVGAASCLVEKEDGSIDIASHRGFPTPWASFKYYFLKDDSLYHLTDRDMKKTHEVDVIVGAFFLVRKSVLDKVGVFDEDYFMYAEDIDLCLRIKEAGYKIMYVPEVKVLHHKGISTGVKSHSQHKTSATLETKRKMTGYFYSTMKLFYQKHYAKRYPFFINWLVYLGIDLKSWMALRKMTV